MTAREIIRRRIPLPRQAGRWIAALLCIGLLTACGGSKEPQTLVSAATYEKAGSLAHLGQALQLRYVMPAVRGGETQATGLLFVPKGQAPAGGWPLVVWAHGTTGIADACAPSRDYDKSAERPTVEALLAVDFAVLAPDYEGLGTEGVHPYLSLSSLGHSIIAAVQAAHQVESVSLSASWSVIGHSEGGFAALAAAQYAAELSPRFPLRATVALAPATYLPDVATAAFANIDALQAAYIAQPSPELANVWANAVLSLSGYGALVAYGMQAQDPAITPDMLLAPSFLPLAAKALNDADCQAFGAAVVADIQRYAQAHGTLVGYPLAVRRDAFDAPLIARLAARNQPATVKLPGPVLYLQGAQDLVVPVSTARTTTTAMKQLGTNVTYVEVAEADHDSIVVDRLAQAVAFIKTNNGH